MVFSKIKDQIFHKNNIGFDLFLIKAHSGYNRKDLIMRQIILRIVVRNLLNDVIDI